MAPIIKSEAEYEAALERVNELWNATQNTPEGGERDALFSAIESYEAEHYPIDDPESFAAVEYHLDRLNSTIEQLPISEQRKAILVICIANRSLVPESILTELSGIFKVPREALGAGSSS